MRKISIFVVVLCFAIASQVIAGGISSLWDNKGSCWTAYYADENFNKKDKIGYVCFNNASINNSCVDGYYDSGKMYAKLWEMTSCYYPSNQMYIIPNFVVNGKLVYMFELKFPDSKKQTLTGKFYNTPFMAKPREYNCLLMRGWKD